MAEKEIIENHDLMMLMNEVIKEEKLDYLAGIDILPVFVCPEISKTKVTQTIKSNTELEHFGKFDYLIKISENVWKVIQEDVRKKVLLHSLLHIQLKTTKKGVLKKCIASHDVSDFSFIVNKYGTEYNDTLKTMLSSIHDFENKEEDKVEV